MTNHHSEVVAEGRITVNDADHVPTFAQLLADSSTGVRAPMTDPNVPPPDRDLRREILDWCHQHQRRAQALTGPGALLAKVMAEAAMAALERALEYHPWFWSTDPNVPDYCAGCAANNVTCDDGRDYLSGLPCPEVAAIGAGLGLPPQQQREFGCWRVQPTVGGRR